VPFFAESGGSWPKVDTKLGQKACMDTNVWDDVVGRIEAKVNRHSFYTWFKPTSFIADNGDAIVVRVPDQVFRDWLTRHYAPIINEALEELQRPGVKITYLADGAEERLAATQAVEVFPPLGEDELADQRAPGPVLSDVPNEGIPSVGLNLRYTFDSFVVGPSNQFAEAACRAVAEMPSRSYNPLYIYGGVGLGKTHLMHAIGHYALRHNPGFELTYISTERFMNEMINAVHNNRIIDFRARYRTVDLLLVDDIQFLAGKEGTQTEFFHTFNALYDSQKQLVLSSDCPPNEIPSLEERLRSRFEWGLIADIQAPDLETKIAILKKKAEAEKLPGGPALTQQLEVRRDAPADCDVPVQDAHVGLVAGNRPQLRRQAPLDGHTLHQEGGDTQTDRSGFQQDHQHSDRVVALIRRGRPGVFHRPSTSALWTTCAGSLISTGPCWNGLVFPQLVNRNLRAQILFRQRFRSLLRPFQQTILSSIIPCSS